jgi:hypothetical protein
MKYGYVFLLVLGVSFQLQAQNNTVNLIEINGFVRDSTDRRPLAGAAIVVDFRKSGTVTDERGHYALLVSTGPHVLGVRMVGYQPIRQNVTLGARRVQELSFEMVTVASMLDEVIVSSRAVNANIQRPILGVNTLNIRQLKRLPAAFGETDVLRGLQMLPGVSSVGEASNGVNIRGGTTDQNLMLLDDTPIFNPTHLFGLFSVYPPDAVSSVDLYKGNVPARFGGRVAGVIDATMSNPSLDQVKLSGGIGLVSTRLAVEIPLLKNRMGLLVAGRGAFSDFLLPLFSSQLKDVRANFADVGAKYFFRINDRNTLSASGYFSHDFFQTNLLGSIADISASATQYAFRSLNLSARWSRVLRNPAMLWQTSVGYVDYVPDILLPELDRTNLVRIRQGIAYRHLKSSVTYAGSKHKAEAGLTLTYHRISPGQLDPGNNPAITPIRLPGEPSLELAAFADDEITVSPRLTVSLGLRYSQFLTYGPAAVRQYATDQPRSDVSVTGTTAVGSGQLVSSQGGPEPRLGLRFALSARTSVKVGYNLMRQYLQTVTNTTTPLPTSRWKTADATIRPQVSQLITAGWFHNDAGNIYEFSAEGYFRQTDRVLDYRPGARFLLKDFPETELLQGQNQSYGLETMITKKKGELTGWLNYTYARSLNQINEGPDRLQQVNNGQPYATNYDRPHTLNASINIRQGVHHSFGFTFAYSTGRPFTQPGGQVVFQGSTYPIYTDRNNARIPDYHRLDFSWNIYQPSLKDKRWQGSWAFTVYNLYGRANAYSVFYRADNTSLTSYKLSVFAAPIVTLAYNFTFK